MVFPLCIHSCAMFIVYVCIGKRKGKFVYSTLYCIVWEHDKRVFYLFSFLFFFFWSVRTSPSQMTLSDTESAKEIDAQFASSALHASLGLLSDLVDMLGQ